MFNIFNKRTLRVIMFVMLNERARQTIYIFLIYRKLETRLSYKSYLIYLKFKLIITIIKLQNSYY